MPDQTLILDADDTLWDNNVYFEETIERVLDLLEPLSCPREQARRTIDDVERRNLSRHGYGVRAFGLSLEEACAGLARDDGVRVLVHVRALVARLAARGPRVLDGVPETLAYLSARHRLLLLTKGDPGEQSGKLARSGLAGYFEAVEVVPEKDVPAYRRLVQEHAIQPQRAWMIGNSPRSDINPSLAAGLNAVFIPHPATWALEQEEVAAGGGRLLVLRRFSELQEHF